MPFCSAHFPTSSAERVMRAVRYFRRSPYTKAWLTNLSFFSKFSIFWGATFFPPDVTMMSFFRSVIRRNPSESSSPMSPVCNHPSASTSSRAELVVLVPVDRRDGRVLREPVSLEDQDTEGVQEFGDRRGERRPPGDGEPEPAAHPPPAPPVEE